MWMIKHQQKSTHSHEVQPEIKRCIFYYIIKRSSDLMTMLIVICVPFVIKFIYIAQYHKCYISVSGLQFVQNTTPSVLGPSHRTRKHFQRNPPRKWGKMGETSGRATEEGSLSQDGQTCNRCRVSIKKIIHLQHR